MDEETWSGWMREYGPPLLRYCHHILGDYHAAQDGVQETFLKAWERRDKFTPGTNASAWLYRIAYTTCVDELRRRKRLLFLPAPEPVRDPDYLGPALRGALDRLTTQERALVYSRVMEERDYKELEQIYNVPAATLRKRYERAKRKLADALTEGRTALQKEELL